MIDVLGEGLRAAALRSPLAYPLVFAAGVATSAGPCVAPRYVALAALANAAQRPWRTIAAFVAGLVGAYVALGLAAGALSALWSSSSVTYAVLAAALAAGGSATLLREDAHPCENARAREAASAKQSASLGGTFLLGVSSALVVSPCCTPVVAGIAGLTALGGRCGEGIALLVAFALGHALPLLAAGALSARIAALLARLSASSAPAVVSGTLMLALAAYYGVLA
ncbi:MAG: cytochrome c-type biosis protein [Candidatus Eremiobacteraeota bacterium]|nr:cytochrome c-type biosis protein [Candidatus Eremiobacteraeota bacterium]